MLHVVMITLYIKLVRVQEKYKLSQNIDKHDVLKESPFSYRVSKEKILIYYNDKNIMVVSGKRAAKLLPQLEDVDEFDEQLVLAKITGNFKRGNERMSKESKKYK